MEQETNSELPLLTFNSLYNILREEKKVKKLQNLPETFYESLQKFLNDKTEEINKNKKNPQKTTELAKQKQILKNSRKIILELINLRCVKISNIAIKNKIFNEEILSPKNILEKEKTLLTNIEKGLQTITKNI